MKVRKGSGKGGKEREKGGKGTREGGKEREYVLKEREERNKGKKGEREKVVEEGEREVMLDMLERFALSLFFSIFFFIKTIKLTMQFSQIYIQFIILTKYSLFHYAIFTTHSIRPYTTLTTQYSLRYLEI